MQLYRWSAPPARSAASWGDTCYSIRTSASTRWFRSAFSSRRWRCHQPRCSYTDGQRLRRDQRRHGGIPATLSERPRLHAGSARLFHHVAGAATSPDAAIQMVSASGAISGVMGGYLLLYPNVRVYTLVPLGFFITSLALPAWVMLGYWFVIQFFSGLVSFGGEMGGVAFWAHLGGFVAGVAVIKLLARGDYIDERQARRWRPRSVIGEY